MSKLVLQLQFQNKSVWLTFNQYSLNSLDLQHVFQCWSFKCIYWVKIVLILPLCKYHYTCRTIPAKIQRAVLSIRILKLTCKKTMPVFNKSITERVLKGIIGSQCSNDRSTWTWQQKAFQEASMLIIQHSFYAILQVRHQLQANLGNTD